MARAERDTLVTAWRGERVGIQAVLYGEAGTTAPLRVRLTLKPRRGVPSPEQWGTAGWVSYVTTDNFQACGAHPNHLTPYQVADVIEPDTATYVSERGKARPIWCTIEVPADATAATYPGTLEVYDVKTGKAVSRLNLKLCVKDRTLPTPHDQHFYTDFWQQPYAVSGYYKLDRWSDAHFDALRPYLKLLARSGQRTVSAILFYEPWGDQSHDKFDAMIRTTKHKDGSWSYDYSIFDRWVELCEACGLDGRINCYSMVPWDMTFRYYDEAAGRDIDLRTTTDSPAYKELWTSFLKSFARHLKEKGWYERTAIAMDERGLPNMLDAYRIAQEAVPGIQMSLAGSYHKELADKLSDYCISYWERFSPEERDLRRKKGWITTTYVCCSTPRPNIFSNSLPVEATWLPLYCVANGFDGFLHWSWMNWGNDPLTDSRFRLFSPGDTYLIYPGPRSSIRYERYMEGIALAEKYRVLREAAETRRDTATVSRLERGMQGFAPIKTPPATTMATLVRAFEDLVNE